jgi:hypothetical protein
MNEHLAPRVFLSYSHDSPDHKRWVAELCTRLRLDGIDIILDQWDLSLGDDITKFMEDGLASSDRVLLICTDNYVRKAEAGVGGVAYERMIVTAELIHDLGTQKFIPVVHQGEGEPVLPKFMGARLYINLGKEKDFDFQYELLLKELHNIPAAPKPPLGSNPFVEPLLKAGLGPSPSKIKPVDAIQTKGKAATELYTEALEIARRGDIIAWRFLVKDIRANLPNPLQKWREEEKLDQIRDVKRLPAIMDSAVSLYSPLFAVALAGVQSINEKFRDQRAVIDELARPRGWVMGGNVAIIHIPRGLLFVFQAIYGASCLDTGQLDLAIELGLTRISEKYAEESLELIRSHDLVGWPDSLGGDCLVSWDYISKAIQRWPWLSHIFALEEDYLVSLTAYYMALSIMELALDIRAESTEELLSGKEIRFDVPVAFLHAEEGIIAKACSILLRCNPTKIWTPLSVSTSDMKKCWPAWVKHSASWLAPAYRTFWDRIPGTYQRLLLDL